MARKPKESPEEQHRRFVETARDLGLEESETAEERAFGKVGLGDKPAPTPPKKPVNPAR